MEDQPGDNPANGSLMELDETTPAPEAEEAVAIETQVAVIAEPIEPSSPLAVVSDAVTTSPPKSENKSGKKRPHPED